MDRYSHNNYNPEPKTGSIKRKIMTLLVVSLIVAIAAGIYLYKPRIAWMQKVASNVISIAHDSSTDNKNDPTPPIHFEFYTALANAKMTDLHSAVAENNKTVTNKAEISLHNELEKEISEVTNSKRTHS